MRKFGTLEQDIERFMRFVSPEPTTPKIKSQKDAPMSRRG